MTDNLYQDLSTSDQPWHCDICSNKISSQMNNEDLIPDQSNELDEDIYAELKQNLKIKGLKVAHLNINGLFHKLSEVKFLLEETKLDVLAVTETHLHEKIKDDDLHIDNYCIGRHDRQNSDNCWGGSLIYFRQEIDGFEREDLKRKSDIEASWIEITVSSQKLLIGSVYRQPHDLNFYGNFQKALEQIWMKRNNILILGDLNSDLLFGGKTPEDTYLGRKLLKVLNSFNMKNNNNKPSRITADTSTIIDLIITSDKSKIKSQGCYDTGISDHHIVHAILHLYRKRSWPKLIEVKNYKDLDVKSLKRDIEQGIYANYLMM